MTFISYEPIESIPGSVDRDECEADGCSSGDGLALVTTTEEGNSGVYCDDCASAFLFGGGR